MKVIIEFNIDNAAFVDDWGSEVGRVLQQARTVLDNHGRPRDGKSFEVIGRLSDINGNKVGHVRLENKDEA